jgi:hypothetical protein
MNEQHEKKNRPSTVVTFLAGIALAVAAGAFLGYILVGTVQGILLGALGIGFFAGKNVVLSVLKPGLPAAVSIGTAAGFLAGLCLGFALDHEVPAWTVGLAGAGIADAEVLIWWWKRTGRE